ncbi:transposase [Bradyrhizobium japonicum SEMIA 5079]|nr:transposase [Bradyrhizobium japonicum SEMIA 5079]
MWKVSQAFCGEQLAVRPLDRDGRYGIFFASWQVASIDLTRGQPVSDVSEQVCQLCPRSKQKAGDPVFRGGSD